MYKKDCFKETMSVRASLIGRAPVVVNSHHVALLDRSAFKVSLYKYDDDKFPFLGTTPDAEVNRKNTWHPIGNISYFYPITKYVNQHLTSLFSEWRS